MREAKSAKDTVYESVLADILSGVYGANAVLNEKALIDQYHVSRSPVREALITLTSEGILQSIPRFGYQVVAIRPQEIREAVEYRTILELGALALFRGKIGPAEIAALRHTIETNETLADAGSIVQHWAHNTAFHCKLCSYSGNAMLCDAIGQVLRFCARGATQFYTHAWQNSISTNSATHHQLVDLLEKGDWEGARASLAADIASMKDAFFQ